MVTEKQNQDFNNLYAQLRLASKTISEASTIYAKQENIVHQCAGAVTAAIVLAVSLTEGAENGVINAEVDEKQYEIAMEFLSDVYKFLLKHKFHKSCIK